MSERDTITLIAEEIGGALTPLSEALKDPARFKVFMRDLGWDISVIPQPIKDLAAPLGRVADVLADGAVDKADVPVLLNAVRATAQAIEEIKNKPAASFPASVNAAQFKNEFPSQLIAFLVIDYLMSRRPLAGNILRALGVIRFEDLPAAAGRPAYTRRDIAWNDLANVFDDPFVVMKSAYNWGGSNFRADELVANAARLFGAWGMPYVVDTLDPELQSFLTDGATNLTPIHNFALRLILLGGTSFGVGSETEAGLALFTLPETASDKPGFSILPYARGTFAQEITLTENLSLVFEGGFDFAGGVALIVRPGKQVQLLIDIIPSVGAGTAPPSSGGVALALVARASEGGKLVIVGQAGGSRFEAGGVSVKGGARVDSTGKKDLFAEFELKDAALVIKPAAGDADSFLNSLLPAGGFTLEFGLVVGLSTAQGFYFGGSGGLEINLPTHLQVGPVEITSTVLAVRPSGGTLPVEFGATVRGDLGVLKAVVENIGLRAVFSFPGKGGNLGPVNLALAFKPPNGVGLFIDAGIVKGGGFLSFDEGRSEYAGALELVFSGFLTLKAIGLITTRMPDGSPGFSLLIIITAEFGTGVQLGFGFTLLAVGGLVGLNRTMRLEPLMEGVRTGAVNSIMFPQDVIANAPRIISDLRAIFPPQPGTFLIGPMAKLGWGTPTLISLSLGVIIEIPGNIAILGVLRMALPAEQAAVLILQVNFVGAIEFDKKRVYFFAALFDSRILYLSISGELGVLAAFGDDANFVVSVGGFHPRFTPPPLPFPSPRRISIDLVNTPIQKVRVEGYFALTTNTAQFGARAELFYGLDELNVQGHIGFDALFQFSPFYFIIEVSASFSVSVFGIGLFSVGIRLSLEGPTKWRARGTGSISLLFFDISVDFDVTWGESRDTTLPPIAVMPLVKAEFEKAANWTAQLPAGNNLLVSLRKLPPEESALVLHPVGSLRVSQKAVPLELGLDKVGNQKPSDVKRLTIAVSTGGLAKRDDAFEQFAPAQFQNIKDAEKLTRPAYGHERAGLELSAAGQQLASSRMVKRVVRYEQIIIDTNFKRFVRRFKLFIPSLFAFFMGGGSVGKCELSKTQKKLLEPFADKVAVKADSYSVALQSNNKAFAAESVSFASEASARDYLARKVAVDPNLSGALHVIPEYERAA